MFGDKQKAANDKRKKRSSYFLTFLTAHTFPEIHKLDAKKYSSLPEFKASQDKLQ